VYTKKKGRSAFGRRKSTQERHRCFLIPLSVDEPERERISLNFNKYFLLCTVVSPERDKWDFYDPTRFSLLVPCPAPISACA